MRTQHTQRKRDDEDDAFENGMLKDGARYTVPLRMMDSWQRDVAQHFEDTVPPHRDADNRPLWQPGFTVAATTKARDSARAARQLAYDSYDQSVSTAWQNTEPLANVTGIGSHGFSGARVGDLCTVRRGKGAFGLEGSAGTIQVVDGALECVADGFEPNATKPPKDSQDASAIKDAAYAKYDAALRGQWRSK